MQRRDRTFRSVKPTRRIACDRSRSIDLSVDLFYAAYVLHRRDAFRGYREKSLTSEVKRQHATESRFARAFPVNSDDRKENSYTCMHIHTYVRDGCARVSQPAHKSGFASCAPIVCHRHRVREDLVDAIPNSRMRIIVFLLYDTIRMI